ncbi:LOW QUALITY PROTEIN: Hypothetical protein PHPALM_18636 [Phytophthora palmivora]|uniref:Uncharacterized protein n=1 Tax=Phytophthora palmivora TaxID=4796 RepID=A0A2P4XJG2_9STRA|nr:LOW QUALITY PROTEIN: Hypothetical protein PHPALM_18636 [Phytophthora palmivora]
MPSALWVAMSGHMTMAYQAPTMHRLLTILVFTGGEMHTLGTAEREAWELIAAVDGSADWKKQQKSHEKAQIRLPANQRTEFVPPMTIAANAGLPSKEDSHILYEWSGRDTSQRVLTQDSVEALRLCHGLASTGTGEQNML